MSVLFTSDWQSQLGNLRQCEEAAKRLLNVAQKKKVETVVIAGDLKETYNPLDYRVIDFWRKFLGSIRDLKITPIVVLGNHDRIGLYDDHRNWLPILQDVGAKVFDDVGIYKLKSGTCLFVLPFIRDVERLKEASRFLVSEETNPKRDILTFHLTLKNARFNNWGTRAEDGVPISALHPERFLLCVGGDIHLRQCVTDNVYYVGSPFPMNWGECNQTKYFALVNEKGIEWIPTGMPGWYDPSVKGFKSPESESWEGTRVRLHVSLGSESIEQVRAKIQNSYPGALISIIPDIKEKLENPKQKALETLSQQNQIRSYIQEVISDHPEEMIGFIEHSLLQTGIGLREDTCVQFLSAKASSFLSFESLSLSFEHPGVILVTGENKDWSGRSNGSGKSNVVSILPVALFGRTIKGQAHDDWCHWGSEAQAVVNVEWKSMNGDQIRVERTRHPGTTRLWVNDREVSSGNRVTDVAKDIELLSGFSWDMFVSLVYISRDEVNFLWGTIKQKQETLSRLLNLERFGIAQKKVKKDIQEIEELLQGRMTELQSLETLLQSKQADKTASEETVKIRIQIRETSEKLKMVQIPNAERLKRWLNELEEHRKEFQESRDKVSQLQGVIQMLRSQFKNLTSLPDTCPTCGQKIPRDKKALQKQIDKIRMELESKCKTQTNLELYVQTRLEKYDKARSVYDQKVEEVTRIKEVQKQLVLQLEKLNSDLQRWEIRERQYNDEVEKLHTSIIITKKGIDASENGLQFLRLADKILQRDALPAYLSEMLIPRLNRAAKKYSEIFTESEIQVQFFMQDGETNVTVLNAHGGPNLEDQSSGEGSLAGLITSFALRDIAPRSNVLILDEPGDGLDAANAQAFAAGIRKLSSNKGTIFLITHNQNIISELSDVREIRVIKENGKSRIDE